MQSTTRIRCHPGAADARLVSALVPPPGKYASVIADGEPGYAATLTIVSRRDGTAAATCK